MSEENKKIRDGVNIEGWGTNKKSRQAKEAAEGVNTATFPREGYLGDPPGAVSLTKITLGDLLSEGRISGLVGGYYENAGTVGKTGWTTSTWTQFDYAPNTTVPWLRSVYWNLVPVVNPKNEFNYQSVTVNFTPGLPNGSVADQISSETTTIRSVGERLRYGPDFAKVYRVLNKNIKAVDVNVRFNQLSKTSTDSKTAGDLLETEVKYNISYRALFNNANATIDFTTPDEGKETVRGKVNYGYIRKTRIALLTANQNFSNDPDFLGWEIKVERMTPDSTVSSIRNQTNLDSIIEVYGDTFSYPNSAIIYSTFSAEYFSQVPTRHYEVRGLQVVIPDTYNPITRSYSPNNGDDWDGSFKVDVDGNIKKEWTDNPAWCYFDLLTNRNYGLGKYITGEDISVDKWTLYEIGRYCDVLVSDGYGRLEPRFSCNAVLNTRDEAFKIVNDMASVFRGMIYYGAGTVLTTQDSPKNPYTLFTNANVENGDFVYSSSSRRVRHTVAIVHYNDKKNYYKPAIEYVEDVEGIRRYGIRELELIAFGCTSRGQAVRFGRWALLSETTETESVSFTAGLEGALIRPGDVIQVSDRNKRGMRYGGRAYQIHSPSAITLDSQIPNLSSTQLYNFSLVTPTWNYDPIVTDGLTAQDATGIRKSHVQKRTFRGSEATSLLGSDDVYRTRIDLPSSNAFDASNHSLSGNLIWMVDSSGVMDPAYNIMDYFRVIKIDEKEPHKFNIGAIEYNVNKYNQIESGLNFGTQTAIDTPPAGPTDLTLVLASIPANSNGNQINYNFQISNITNITKYLVYVKAGSDFNAGDTDTNQYLVKIIPPRIRYGTYIPTANNRYYFRVYSATSNNTKSTTYATNDILVTNINPIADLVVQSLRLDSDEDPTQTTDDETTEINDPGSRQAGTYTSADPTYLWQLGYKNNALINFSQTGLGYRVTIREPSQTNTPTKTIYYTPNVQLTGKFDNLSYTFPFDENRTLVGGPFRNYDIVVEAVNTHDGTSAAGGNYKLNADTTFSNPNSYDIFTASNPPINDFKLTDATKNVASPYNTEQWITTDGSIKLLVKNNVPPDWVGGLAYVWTGFEAFTTNEAYKKFDANFPADITVNKNIIRIPFEGSGDNGLITIPTGITGYNAAYMSISPVDAFDLARYDAGVLTDSQLTMSNVVKVQKRLGFNDKLLFNSWAETNVDYNNQNLAVDWTNYSVGIKGITFEQYNDPLEGNGVKFKWNFNFDTPMPNTNYVVLAPNSGENVRTDSQIIKRLDGVQLVRFKGVQFIAVLYNGN